MLEGKSEKLEFQEMLSSPHQKIKMSKNKTKMLKKREPGEIENQRKNDCHVMHLKNSTKSKRESRKPNSRKKNVEKK